jgi:adenine deaminase
MVANHEGAMMRSSDLTAETSFLARVVRQGRGIDAADLVLKGGRILDLVSGALTVSDVAICGDRIVGTYGEYRGQREIDVQGRIVAPGFIDTHVHIESSLVTPTEFDRCVLPHGITTAICDPHEIANVLGAEGIRYFLDASRVTVLDLFVQLSSCVPATELETSGARLELEALLPFADDAKVIGLAEMMNFPGVLAGDRSVLAKLAAFQRRHIDGHAPLLTGRGLNAYLACGIRTDHETTSAAEALEKLSKGMIVLIREGSVSKDLKALCSIISERTSSFLCFCTDDRNPLDIAEQGHIDHMIRTAIQLGAPVLAVYRAATISAARAFGLNDRGLVAPGYRADLVVLDELLQCNVECVISAGRIVDDQLFAARPKLAEVGRGSVKAEPTNARDFVIRGHGPSTPVIGVIPGKIITEFLTMAVPIACGEHQIDLHQDIIKVAVVARHGFNRNIGLGFVHGFGMKRGAIASSVGHDSHNICVVGVDATDMAIAVNRLIELEGGFAVACGGQIRAELALPVAGLMSLASFEAVRSTLTHLRTAARQLGVILEEPFLQVAFLPLPVIPHLKITDRGLVDVDRHELLQV